MERPGIAMRLSWGLLTVALVTALAAASAEAFVAMGSFANAGGNLYLAADDGVTGLEPRKWEVGAAQWWLPPLVKDVVPGAAGSDPRDFTAVGDTVFFIAGQDELWKTDGTEAGTQLVWKPEPSFNFLKLTGVFELTAFGGTLLFVGCDEENLCRIRTSDGTTAGTVILEEPSPGWSAPLVDPTVAPILGLTLVDDTLFFIVRNGLPWTSTQLWKTDGTVDGTALVHEWGVGGFGKFVAAGGNLFFPWGTSVWKSDGTSAGTGPVSTSVNVSDDGLAAAGSIVFFAGTTSPFNDDVELWKTDGTAAGTVRVRDIAPPGPFGDSSRPSNLTVVVPPFSPLDPGTLFFTADDGTNGRELWKSDGTEAGTVLVKDITPGPASTVFSGFVSYDGLAYFSADNGVNGAEFWRSDGTATGTAGVDLIPGAASSSPSDLTPVGERLFFAAGVPNVPGRYLWVVTDCVNHLDDDGDGAIDGADAGCGNLLDVSERAPDLPCDDGLDNDGDGATDSADAGCSGPSDPSELFACSDGLDGDGDGLADALDPGCIQPDDDSERETGLVCDDGLDDDGDGVSDFGGPSADPGCLGIDDPSEQELGVACDDGIDNDGDSAVDYIQDYGCSTRLATSEQSPEYPCDNGIDDDADGSIDFQDTGCALGWSDGDEFDPWRTCDNGVDDDGDGAIDLADAGCSAPADESERSDSLVCDNGLDDDGDGLVDFPADVGCASPQSVRENPQCQDGINNGDADGLIDWPADPECSSYSDNTETKPSCGFGAELALVLPLLGWMRSRRRRTA